MTYMLLICGSFAIATVLRFNRWKGKPFCPSLVEANESRFGIAARTVFLTVSLP